MQTYTMADLGQSPKKVCAENEPVLITNNGRPQSIIINVREFPIDQSISLAQELYGRYCVRQLRRRAVDTGLDALSDDELHAEIAATRSGRREK
ncbi:MAG: hypothetical protein LBP68_07085 [Acidobacteriota bacterium]|nr:hypothetical protein [Acidobacteriota bacterium]